MHQDRKWQTFLAVATLNFLRMREEVHFFPKISLERLSGVLESSEQGKIYRNGTAGSTAAKQHGRVWPGCGTSDVTFHSAVGRVSVLGITAIKAAPEPFKGRKRTSGTTALSPQDVRRPTPGGSLGFKISRYARVADSRPGIFMMKESST